MVDDNQPGGLAIASLILGCFGGVAWFLPFIGFPVTVIGLALGFIGLKSNRRRMAIAGLILCILFLIITIINSSIGAYMGAKNAIM